MCNAVKVPLHQNISFRHADSEFAMKNLFGVFPPAKFTLLLAGDFYCLIRSSNLSICEVCLAS